MEKRCTVKPDFLGIWPRWRCPRRATRSGLKRATIRAQAFPTGDQHLEAESLMDLSAALRQVRSWCGALEAVHCPVAFQADFAAINAILDELHSDFAHRTRRNPATM